MIFSSKNEKGEPAWELVMKDEKTVTRRMKPQQVGAIRAVQPGRGKKAVGYVRVKSCILHSVWQMATNSMEPRQQFTTEANKEGFESWDGLLAWFNEHKIDIKQTFRIEFELEGK